ncbi:MAG TPA: SH3 domain-containing protein [Candidatus Angelobacter sp.]|nr:SH3 domain-containing protein [Candidatus Angelobacter sp.]
MLRLRVLLLLAASTLFVSAAWADDIGYIDCASHPDPSQVYTKPRQSQDVVGSVACGERFFILVNGFIFSRIQTTDGKIGFVLSSLISVDHSATSLTQANAGRTAAPATKATAAPAPQPAAAVAQVQPQPAAAQTQPAPAQPSVQSQVTPAVSSAAPTPSVNTQPAASTASQPAQAAAQQPEPVAAQSASAPASSAAPAAAPASAISDQPAAPASVLPTPPPPPDTQPASAQPSSTPSMLTPPPPASATPQPAPAAATQPEPASAQPEAVPVRSASVRSTWEKPVPAGRQASLMEFFGGFSFARFDGGGGTFNNMMGGLGSFGVNLTSWFQVTGDSSYNFVTISGTKNVLYGNHFGPRVYYRKRNRWGITPFGEALIGGSRLDTTVSGASGYNTSTNCISYKFGGGVDMRASRHLEIRVFDFDYYRTAFGTNLHQNNYSASVGVVLRLFGGATE